MELQRHDRGHSDISKLVALASVLFAVTGVMLWISDRPYEDGGMSYGSHFGSYAYGYGAGYGGLSGQHAFAGDQINWAWTALFFGVVLALVAVSVLLYMTLQRRKYRREADAIWLLALAAACDSSLKHRGRYLALEAGHRCSDLDRARVGEVVQRNYAIGTLTAEEMAQRAESVHRARTLGELGPALSGLRWRWPDLTWLGEHPRWMAGLAAPRCQHGCCRYDHGCLGALSDELARLRDSLLPSEAERAATCGRLIDAVADGRLGLDELDQRLDQVDAARSEEQLAAVVADLPDRTAERRLRQLSAV